MTRGGATRAGRGIPARWRSSTRGRAWRARRAAKRMRRTWRRLRLRLRRRRRGGDRSLSGEAAEWHWAEARPRGGRGGSGVNAYGGVVNFSAPRSSRSASAPSPTSPRRGGLDLVVVDWWVGGASGCIYFRSGTGREGSNGGEIWGVLLCSALPCSAARLCWEGKEKRTTRVRREGGGKGKERDSFCFCCDVGSHSFDVCELALRPPLATPGPLERAGRGSIRRKMACLWRCCSFSEMDGSIVR